MASVMERIWKSCVTERTSARLGDRSGEVVGAILLEERGEEGQRGGSGGGADDVEGRVEEVLGVADEGDAAVLDGGEVLEEDAVEHDQRDADHERKGELEPVEKGGRFEVNTRREVEAGAEGSEGVEQSGAEDDAAEHANVTIYTIFFKGEQENGGH